MKKTPQTIGIRLADEDKELLDRIGYHLHTQGLFGMTESDGTVNRSAVIRYLIRQTGSQLPEKTEKKE